MRKNKFFLITALLIFLVRPAFAKPDDKGIFGVVFENDLFTGKDAGYTNGIRFSYTSSEEQMPTFVRSASNYLPLLNRDGKKRITVALGQSMYTPQDITKADFTANDFFYAGWLYGSLGIISDADTMFDNVVLTLGMVGPSAQAEQTQKFVHQVVGSPESQGWSHQLKDEPGVMLSYERHWRDILLQKKKVWLLT
jgi:lipid A 3-O-deacylase